MTKEKQQLNSTKCFLSFILTVVKLGRSLPRPIPANTLHTPWYFTHGLTGMGFDRLGRGSRWDTHGLPVLFPNCIYYSYF